MRLPRGIYLGAKGVLPAITLVVVSVVLRAANAPAALPHGQQVIAFLNQAIAWYQH